jgi:hypothetical protein
MDGWDLTEKCTRALRGKTGPSTCARKFIEVDDDVDVDNVVVVGVDVYVDIDVDVNVDVDVSSLEKVSQVP